MLHAARARARLILVPSALRFGDGGYVANTRQRANVRRQ